MATPMLAPVSSTQLLAIASATGSLTGTMLLQQVRVNAQQARLRRVRVRQKATTK